MREPAQNEVPSECAEFERLLATIGSDLGKVRPEEFDGVLVTCLRKLIEFVGFDRGCVLMFCREEDHLTVTHCRARKGVPPEMKGRTLDEDLW